MLLYSVLCLLAGPLGLLLVSANVCCMCTKEWKEVYTNFANGSEASGSKEDLHDAVLNGARVRFLVDEWGHGAYTAEVDNLSVRDEEVCAQALMHVSRSGWFQFHDNAYWWFLTLCTSGHVHMSRYSVGASTSGGETRASVSITWFVKEMHQGGTCHIPLYSHQPSGSRISGQKEDLVGAVLRGYDIRAVTRDSGYAFPLHNMAVSDEQDQVSGQCIWHVSQKDVESNIEFQPNAYWWFTIWSTTGLRDMSRWTVGDHVDRGHTDDKVGLDWFADRCWKHVYTNDENGYAVAGSLDSLVLAVEQGHRVKVAMANYSVEADNVRANLGHVTAQLLSQVSKASQATFQDNVYWYWQMVHTSGVITTYRYNVGSHVPRGNGESTQRIQWFVDTRPWQKILETTGNGQVTFGSKSLVREAIKRGASVRLGLQFAPNSKYFAKADNLEFGPDEETSAQLLKHVSQAAAKKGTYVIQNNPYWWFIIVSTQSNVDMSRWTVGEHVNRGYTSQKVKIVEWFVNY